jgi:hypothetical protein
MARLRTLVIAAGVGWAVLFVVVGLRFGLQQYADGSLFSYAVAVQDAWEFHWHNISGRLLVYLFSLLPAETYVGLTGDARGGIALYGFLFYGAQLLGLAATFAADRSDGRIIFAYACLSTACLCPLVYGLPTEMWMAHAVFWPALALCHYARPGIAGTVVVFVALLALVLTHEGALVFAAVIVFTLILRGVLDAALLRAAGAFAAALAVWALVKLALPPDDYFASIIERAALGFVDIANFTSGLFVLLLAALAGYAIAIAIFRRLLPAQAHLLAALLIAAMLCIYWLWFDQALHTDNRYGLRTALFGGTVILGCLASAYALRADDRLSLPVPLLPRLLAALATEGAARAAFGAVVLVMLVNAVETVKFVAAWTEYKGAVRALAMGTASDPALGYRRFVSSARLDAKLNRLAWSSTTHFLSVLLAPKFAPVRLVVDPGDNYIWLSCRMAMASEQAERAIPVESRRLVRLHACLHRR